MESDKYEQKLYQMFSSHDREERSTLNREELAKLCISLELRDAGAALIADLFAGVTSKERRVSYQEFKEALLKFLGSEMPANSYESETTNDSHEVETSSSSIPLSPGREVSPKCIVGTKKYGRRSRPTSANLSSSSLSESDNEATAEADKGSKVKEVQKSASQSDVHSYKRVIGSKLKRCASLPAQRNRHEHTKSLQTQLEVVQSVDFSPESDVVPFDVIVDMWENAGVLQASNLLANLGFSGRQINISDLSASIDHELQVMRENAAAIPLLRASLVLHKAEVNGLQVALRQLASENQKLHSDNQSANQRAVLLAQEIDERHANIENSTRSEIRALEQRHADAVRELTVQMTKDREQLAALNGKLEERIKLLETEQVRLKSDNAQLRSENSAFESEQTKFQGVIADLTATNQRLNTEIAELGSRQDQSEAECEEMQLLMQKISLVQKENVGLRDKNDELCAEIESVSMELKKMRTVKGSSKSPGNSEYGDDVAGECEDVELNVANTLAIKRRGDSPSKRINEESPRLGKFRKYSDDSADLSDNPAEWAALNMELEQAERKSEPKTADEVPEETPKVATDTDDVEKLRERVNELEASLEMMRKEFDDCEDYWQSKLNTERRMFEEEQSQCDEKLSELLQKMMEYEEQFKTEKSSGRLTPIQEKDNLEQQYAELESEICELKEKNSSMLVEKSEEIAELKGQIKALMEGSQSQLAWNDDASSASSPMNYLWNQSTIHAPARDYHNPNWQQEGERKKSPPTGIECLTTTETSTWAFSPEKVPAISPIQKPKRHTDAEDAGKKPEDEGSASVKSAGGSSHSGASTYNIRTNASPDEFKNDIQELATIKNHLEEEIKDITYKRDCLLMEVQQLSYVKPTRTEAAKMANVNLQARVQHLEQKNRQLQSVLKQQQHYAETIMHQTWQQQRSEISELRNRLEAQSIIITEQAQRLANADILVKDLYVENSHLTSNMQRLEQQNSRNAYLFHYSAPGPKLP
ncbi:blastoderm-specific protein 25D [Phlebotomus argentipes]|uniref:blastoderm-specific protein 25D n=1 Tax=Phlebotomus argentipes TaxID=94469 RepID=UPI0028936F89|nr:blastoderm-specific protein 25D [Phlebotomus argentipes]